MPRAPKPSLSDRARALRREREPICQPGPVEGSLIREARPGDITTIIALRGVLFEAMGAAAQEVSDATWQRDAARWLQLQLAHDDVQVIVADLHGAVVSCAMGQVLPVMPSPLESGLVGQLSNVATFPPHRRLGFSEACVEVLLAWFRKSTEVTSVRLHSTAGGAGLYERLGFVRDEQPRMRLRIERPQSAAPA